MIGIVGKDDFGIGDTLTENPEVLYDEIPRFPPETFSYLHNPNTAKYKRFRDGLQQLLQEGVIQQFEMNDSLQKVPLLAAVGPLQFEVVQYRLESEYGAESRFEPTPYSLARWYRTRDNSEADLSLPFSAALATDLGGQKVVLFQDEWSLRYFLEKNSELEVSEIPFKEISYVPFLRQGANVCMTSR